MHITNIERWFNLYEPHIFYCVFKKSTMGVLKQKQNMMVRNNIISMPNLDIEPTESVGTTLFKFMQIHKDNIAQIDASTGEKDTYEQLLQRCISTAIYLQEKKITRDDIIGLCASNHLNSVVPFVAAQFLGCRVASIDPLVSREEFSYLLSKVSPTILFLDSDTVLLVSEVLKELSLETQLVVFGESSTHSLFSDCLQSKGIENFQPVTIPNLMDTAAIFFSSGTTGLPKGICLNHYSLLGQTENTLSPPEDPDFERIKEQQGRISCPLTFLNCYSLHGISSGMFVIFSIKTGTCRMFTNAKTFNAKECWKFIIKYKPMIICLTPVHVMELVEVVPPSNVDIRSLITIVIITSALPEKKLMEARKALPDVDIYHAYGQTETVGILCTFKGTDKKHREYFKNKPTCVGLPVKGICYKVIDLKTKQALGPHKCGELHVKSKLFMNGYYNQDSSESYSEDGWLKTGDIVYYDQDYCFFVVDRIKEVIKYRGNPIVPAMLENHLLNHPDVKQAVVIGIPHDEGEYPMGLVVVRDNTTSSEKDIETFVETRVQDRQRLRAGVRFIKEVPLTVTGKVDRRRLKRMFIDTIPSY